MLLVQEAAMGRTAAPAWFPVVWRQRWLLACWKPSAKVTALPYIAKLSSMQGGPRHRASVRETSSCFVFAVRPRTTNAPTLRIHNSGERAAPQTRGFLPRKGWWWSVEISFQAPSLRDRGRAGMPGPGLPHRGLPSAHGLSGLAHNTVPGPEAASGGPGGTGTRRAGAAARPFYSPRRRLLLPPAPVPSRRRGPRWRRRRGTHCSGKVRLLCSSPVFSLASPPFLPPPHGGPAARPGCLPPRARGRRRCSGGAALPAGDVAPGPGRGGARGPPSPTPRGDAAPSPPLAEASLSSPASVCWRPPLQRGLQPRGWCRAAAALGRWAGAPSPAAARLERQTPPYSPPGDAGAPSRALPQRPEGVAAWCARAWRSHDARAPAWAWAWRGGSSGCATVAARPGVKPRNIGRVLQGPGHGLGHTA